MKAIKKLAAFILLSVVSIQGFAQPVTGSSISRIEKNKTIITLDLSWETSRLFEIARAFRIDSALIENIIAKQPIPDSLSWHIELLSQQMVELSKSIENLADKQGNGMDILLLEEGLMAPAVPGISDDVRFGCNHPKVTSVYTEANGNTTFFLEGYPKARFVYLSGSFNQWSTLQDAMLKHDRGWILTLPLMPGKHTYKFIVDGRWLHDPENSLKEDDGQGGFNSIVFVNNYRFALKGFEDAKKVNLSGSFNNWHERNLPMKKIQGGWELPVYLKEGTYFYKFIVDNNWITDPSNPEVRTDAYGNQNSFISFGTPYAFLLKEHLDASQVVLSGSFNGWSHNELVMEKTLEGWKLDYVLSPGNYEYKFIVDGKWVTDPANPIATGENDFMNSWLSVMPNHIFSLAGFETAKQVLVTGSFNGWITNGYRMIQAESGWEFPMYLKPGKYQYKFIVDGQYIIDPSNEWWEENEFGTGNSILWVE